MVPHGKDLDDMYSYGMVSLILIVQMPYVALVFASSICRVQPEIVIVMLQGRERLFKMTCFTLEGESASLLHIPALGFAPSGLHLAPIPEGVSAIPHPAKGNLFRRPVNPVTFHYFIIFCPVLHLPSHRPSYPDSSPISIQTTQAPSIGESADSFPDYDDAPRTMATMEYETENDRYEPGTCNLVEHTLARYRRWRLTPLTLSQSRVMTETVVPHHVQASARMTTTHQSATTATHRSARTAIITAVTEVHHRMAE